MSNPNPTELPQQTSNRDYSQGETLPPIPLLPGNGREREIVDRFKGLIVQHFTNRGDKSTDELLEGLALDLWRVTRGR